MNTDIFLVRHGIPELQNVLLGSTDASLSQAGWKQMNASVRKLVNIDTYLSSPLLRCTEFAKEYTKKNKKNLLVDDAWRECHFGDWDGKSYQSLLEKFPQEMADFFNQPNVNMPPRAEPLLEFSQRIENAMHSLVKEHAGQRVAVFTHAGVIRTLVAWCLQMDYSQGLQFRRFTIDYASITHLSVYSEGEIFPQIVTMNHRPDDKNIR